MRPADSHRYDLVGVPELVAQSPATWVICELADVVSIPRSLPDVCALDVVHAVLDSPPCFTLPPAAPPPFARRAGSRPPDTPPTPTPPPRPRPR